MYPPTTSESSAGNSSFESSARPSRNRYRSPTATVTSSIHATRALVPSRADLLPAYKRFRDSISPEDSVEEDIDTDVLADIEADAMADEVAVDRDVEAGVDAGIGMEVDVRVDVEDEVEDEVESSDRGTIEVGVDVATRIDIPDGMLMPDAMERLEQVEEGLQDIYDHVIEIPLQRIEDIEIGQRELEARSLIYGGERASLLEQVASLKRSTVRLRGTMMMERARADRRLETFRNMTITRSGMTPEAIKELVNRRVEEALAAYEATRAANALEADLLCYDSESDTEIPKRHVSPTPHDAMLTRWRSKVASRSSSPTTSTPEIPTAPILPAPSAVVAPSSEFPLAFDIPIGRLYHTHLGGPCTALTTRKSVRPLPSHRLALRYTSHHLDRFTFGSSLGHSSLDHSSSGYSISGHSLSRHASPNTTITDSSTPPRFVYPPLARTLRCSEAYLCWRSTLLSTMYPPMTSESSAGDSSFELSARPSCKRCRSHATTVTLSIHATRALVPYCVDLLLPHKRFRDSILPEDSVEEDINTDVLADIEADAMADEVVIDKDVEAGVDTGNGMEVGVDVVAGIDIPDGMLMPDAVECLEQVEEGLQDIYEHIIEITLQRIEDIKMGHRELESRSLVAGGERASLLEQVASLERRNARLQGTMMTERARADRFRRCVSFMESELRQIRRFRYYDRMQFRRLKTFAVSDGDNGNGGNRNGRDGNGRNGNGENGNSGNENPNENNRGARLVSQECTYQDFIKCQPLNFKGTEGVVGLIRTVGTEAAFSMSWSELMKLMAEEEDRVDKFIGGLPDNIQGNVIVVEPTKLQDAVRIANNLMDQKLKGLMCRYYPIWEVIQNGNGPVSVTLDTTGQIKILPPKTAEEMVLRERERRARTTC
ncbi:hypothetical protein Tco_0123502 [Tanacetum coccineum]